jgi:hypothetical protein
VTPAAEALKRLLAFIGEGKCCCGLRVWSSEHPVELFHEQPTCVTFDRLCRTVSDKVEVTAYTALEINGSKVRH